MSEESNHENFVERIFDHHHHHRHGEKKDNQDQSGGQEQKQGHQSQQNPEYKESEMDKFRDYIKEDEKIEQEGGTYGGLM